MPSSEGWPVLQVTTANLLISVRHASRGPKARSLLKAFTGIDASGLERLVLLSIRGQELVPNAQIAAELRVSLPLLSRSCRSLEKRGQLIKVPDPRDARRTLIGLSDHTAAALRSWDLMWPTTYAEAVARWPDRDRDDLGRWFAEVNFELLGPSGEPHDRYAWTPPVHRQHLAHPGVVRFTNAIRELVTYAGRSGDVQQLLASAHAGVTESAFFTLFTLREHPDGSMDGAGVPVRELAELEAVDPALTRRTLSALAQLDLVEQPSTNGNGASLSRLSARGHDLVTAVVDAYARRLPQHVHASDPTRLAALLERFFDGLAASTTVEVAATGSNDQGTRWAPAKVGR